MVRRIRLVIIDGDDWLRAVCWKSPVALFGAPAVA
jgi:hypothetical protein